jgi:thioredoxin 1
MLYGKAPVAVRSVALSGVAMPMPPVESPKIRPFDSAQGSFFKDQTLRKDQCMPLRGILQILCIFLVLVTPFSCGREKSKAAGEGAAESASAPAEAPTSVHVIASEDEYKRIVEGSGDRLLAFDLYANWCMPCRMLSPTLEKIAAANSSRVSFFKINLEKLPDFAQTFNVNGIPHVAFIKKKEIVENVVGMHPEATYLEIISRYAGR